MDEMNIKELRKVLNLTQSELAQKVGVDVGTVSRWERGEVKPSRLAIDQLSKLVKLAMR